MSGQTAVHHDAHPSRRPDGFKRWFAVCPYGWVRAGGGKEGALHLAALHNKMNGGPVNAA